MARFKIDFSLLLLEHESMRKIFENITEIKYHFVLQKKHYYFLLIRRTSDHEKYP